MTTPGISLLKSWNLNWFNNGTVINMTELTSKTTGQKSVKLHDNHINRANRLSHVAYTCFFESVHGWYIGIDQDTIRALVILKV